METQDTKILEFGCKHCENKDMKHFKFNSLEVQSEQWRNSPYKSNWNRETTPKTPVGLHLRCAKCGKDTFIIPNTYDPTEWGNDIPQQCIVNVIFEKPAYSSVQYILTDTGELDQIVTTNNNEHLSFITKEKISDNVKFSVIGKIQYEILKKNGLKEVGFVQEVVETPVKQNENVATKHNNSNNNHNNKKEGN